MTKLSDAEYEQWGQHICPCLNPYCEPKQRALCISRAYPQHKASVRAWLKEKISWLP